MLNLIAKMQFILKYCEMIAPNTELKMKKEETESFAT